MDNTGWALSEISPARHSTLHVAQSEYTIPILHCGLTTYPDGGVRRSVAHVSKFFIALVNDGAYQGERILQKRWLDEMLRFQFTDASKPKNVSLAKGQRGTLLDDQTQPHPHRKRRIRSGVETELLADLSKEVGVILFVTSLPEEEMRRYFAIFLELWRHAEALKGEKAWATAP